MPNEAQPTERDREIAQGLRTPSGSLIGGLHVEDYVQGRKDFVAGQPPPRVTSTSYDLGRKRASQEAEDKADLFARLKAEQDAACARVRELIAHRPDLLAEYDAKMAKIDARHGE